MSKTTSSPLTETHHVADEFGHKWGFEIQFTKTPPTRFGILFKVKVRSLSYGMDSPTYAKQAWATVEEAREAVLNDLREGVPA